ncbi:hypothetical protein UG54_00695 [Gordonia sihwensis]|nr:hypothetical protein UG54_00695 [Gordonia sihwensis]
MGKLMDADATQVVSGRCRSCGVGGRGRWALAWLNVVLLGGMVWDAIATDSYSDCSSEVYFDVYFKYSLREGKG